jgi:predicted nucleic acid-binding protein
VVASHQELTRQWWDRRAMLFDLVVSELVREEASGGDPEASRRRIEAIESIAVLRIDDAAIALAEQLVSHGPIPPDFAADALHIAIAAANGVDYLLTWNCTHLANAAHRHRIETLVEDAGYACPVICTPEELMED